MGRQKKNGSVSKNSFNHTVEEKKQILDNIIKQRKINDLTLGQICEKEGISPQQVYNWLKLKEFESYKKEWRMATKIGDYNSNEELVISAKKSLRDIVEGKVKKTEITKNYKVNEAGERILVQEFVKEITLPADFEQIKWILEHLSPVYSDNSTKNVLQTFMSFNTYLQEISPDLAQKISVLQNNFLSKSVKDIEEIK